MQRIALLFVLSVLLVFAGCETPGDPRFWYDHQIGEVDGMFPYHVQVTVSDPGCKIEVNDTHVGTITNTVGEILLWGDRDGHFRGNQRVHVVANPVKPGQYQQSKYFNQGDARDAVPHSLYFDLALVPPPAPTGPVNQNININKNGIFR